MLTYEDCKAMGRENAEGIRAYDVLQDAIENDLPFTAETFHEIASEAEKASRSFSPFEFTARALNDLGEGGFVVVDAEGEVIAGPFATNREACEAAREAGLEPAESVDIALSADEAWEAFEEGVNDAVHEIVKETLALAVEDVIDYALHTLKHEKGLIAIPEWIADRLGDFESPEAVVHWLEQASVRFGSFGVPRDSEIDSRIDLWLEEVGVCKDEYRDATGEEYRLEDEGATLRDYIPFAVEWVAQEMASLIRLRANLSY